ncbi:MAG: GntR family transcriptional regulator [Lacticaseibacillus paracasei]|uniref:GntR family transcriptional regulator n=1 Tax=Lactobacillaceae TaxID=33958 RepID=UPI001F510663|nr:GntR family transcriptional regulator [Lacticaseibacillus paracasei]MCI0375896.1 GntR family transcriptional regulator [Lacticaseibacillus paracasei]MCI0375959.1 GntR family transcriptional regulator [Lacticaseibacillus paracasei]MCP9305885.1 GntR family transcriptional regulator [Lacticaseibacillus paracasei]MCP9311378.1 GntR family transcriptional regulator [Lacticaseibacillus paracasei]MCP9348111.1 GntR family transcriptional regulator [Lacticaseibacillus paracasei]
MTIRSQAVTPLYEQIRNEIRQAILDGNLKRGEQLPSESDLCTHYEVSRITIRKALTLLTDEGLVIRRQGKGSFVAPTDKVQGELDRTLSFSDYVTQHGMTSDAHVLKREVVKDANIAATLNLEADADLFAIQRILSANNIPMMIETSWYPATKFSDLLTRVTDDVSVYRILQQSYNERIDRSIKDLNVVLPDESISKQLKLKQLVPLFAVDKTSFNIEATPIEYSHFVVRGDMMTYTVASGEGYFRFDTQSQTD